MGTPPRLEASPPAETWRDRGRWALPWLAMIVLAGALAPLRQHWPVQLLMLAWLAFAPGRLGLAALRLRPLQVRRFPTYVVTVSLFVLMATGLLVDGIGIALGDPAPLRTGPLWAGLTGVYLVLVLLAAAAPAAVRPVLTAPASPAAYAWLALPLLAVIGALRLNAGAGPTVALAGMVLLVLGWLARPFLPGFDARRSAIAVYALSLTGMWSFSLRGDNVYGYDIITEHFLGQYTTDTGVWHLSHVGDAYGSLLSVTVLPTMLHDITGTAVLVVFKAVFPALFAFVPVAILRLAGRLVPLRWAWVAVGCVVGQPFFFDSLPAVSRQEIAFLFFVSLVAALVERTRRWQLASLVLICSIGLAFAHYSTSYMTVALLGGASIATIIGVVFRRRAPSARVIGALGCVLGASVVWYRLLTHSASNVTGLAQSLEQNGLNVLPNRTGNVVTTFISGNITQPLTPAAFQARSAALYRAQYPFLRPWPDASRYRLRPEAAVASGSTRVSELAGLGVSLVGQLINLTIIVGVVVILLRGRTRAGRVIGLLGMGVLGFLILIRISGTVSLSYNQERAQLQAFILLAPIGVWLLHRMTRARRRAGSPRPWWRPSWRWLGAAVSLGAVLATTVLVANSAGLLTTDPTGTYGGANLAPTGEDDLRFVQTDPDLLAAGWLVAHRRASDPIYADNYGQLRILAVTGAYNALFTAIAPATLGRAGWIYVDAYNVMGQTRGNYDGAPVSYAFPFGFVGSHYDRVYTNGTAEVYHR